jgi:hypothetical protein
MAKSKTLPVPYFTQTTETNCQGTVLKMMASYLDALSGTPGAGGSNATDIKSSVNSGKGPSRLTNAHANFKWWLEQNYPKFIFEYSTLKLEFEAIEKVVFHIDRGFPVLMAVNHELVEGHIVLVVGYENYRENQCSNDFRFVVHDPYGEFDPVLHSNLYGKHRYDKGACFAGGGEVGPGTSNRLPASNLSRQRSGDPYRGTFYLLGATGKK